jgi:hypothetical protein
LSTHIAAPQEGWPWSGKTFVSDFTPSSSISRREFEAPKSVDFWESPSAPSGTGARITEKKVWKGSATSPAARTEVLVEFTGTWPIVSSN